MNQPEIPLIIRELSKSNQEIVMKKLTLALACAASISAFSINANAEDCTWAMSGLTISSSTQTYTNTFSCLNNGSIIAKKTVSVKAKNTACSITINDSDYTNEGNCTAPKILHVNTPPAPGSKVCEFNDPAVGTTPGCTQNSIAGSSGTVAYQVRKNGQPLLVVSKTTNQYNRSCTLAGENADYYTSGDCNNYRVHAK